MSSYKLTYFDVRARGELCRYILHVAGQNFVDERLTSEQWQSRKSESPFGQLPYLTVGGRKLAESHSIARYLSREFGLAGKDQWQQALTDQYIELIEDMFKEIVKPVFEKDENKKIELQTNLDEVVFPKFLGLLEKELQKSSGKYLVGNSLTVADLAVYNGFDTPMQNNPQLMDKYPKLKAHRAMVASIPSLSAYIKHRKHYDI